MRNTIGTEIKVKPNIFQIAKDNKWEECWTIDLAKDIPSKVELESYLLKQPFSYLAVEYLWNQKNENYVLGIGYRTKMLIKDPLSFLEFTLKEAQDYTNFIDLLDTLDKALWGKSYFLNTKLSLLRISIFNYWFSAGPVDIWKAGEEKTLSLADLKAKFLGHENIVSTTLNFPAMAILFDNEHEELEFGSRHWLKVPVATKIKTGWELNFEKVLEYLEKIKIFM